jgi:hypothetical protein
MPSDFTASMNQSKATSLLGLEQWPWRTAQDWWPRTSRCPAPVTSSGRAGVHRAMLVLNVGQAGAIAIVGSVFHQRVQDLCG